MIRKIAPDKWKHFFVGIMMGAVLQITGYGLLPGHRYWASAMALSVVIAISYGWELLSKITGRGHYEIMDAVASVIGGITGMGIAVLGWLLK